MTMAWRCTTPMKSPLVNWLHPSVFMVWGAPYFAIASSSAATADIAAEAIRQPHARTWRVAQSSTAVRSEATAHRNVGRVHCPHLNRRVHAQPTQQIRIAIRGV